MPFLSSLIFPQILATLASLPRPERLWSPPSLLSNGYQGLFPRGKAAGAWSWLLTSI